MFSSKKSGLVKWFGKGGRGVVTGTKLFFECIKEQYGNPELVGEFIYAPGAERRGSDISAQGVIAEQTDGRWLKIQEFGEADIFVAFSEDAVEKPEVLGTLKPGGKLIVNSKMDAEELVEQNPQLAAYEVFCIDATGTYSQAFGQVHGRDPSVEEIRPNGPMVAAMAAATGLVEQSTLEHVIEKYWGNGGAVTLLASRLTYDKITCRSATAYAQVKAGAQAAGKIFMEVPISAPDLGSAGVPTGTWRMGQELYVDLTKCVRCSKCVDYCPEGGLKRRDHGAPVIDKEYCKGCGICYEVCPKGAIGYRSVKANGS